MILLVEQNVSLGLKLADRVYVLENGRIALEGKTEEVKSDDRIKKAYIGG
jgi:branched-chain amino acid transport system ATP-binding protein